MHWGRSEDDATIWDKRDGDALMGPMEIRIREKIEGQLAPVFYELVNESHTHSVPANSETHFKLLLVSDQFIGLSRLERSRLVHAILDQELKGGVHALTHKTLTPDEYRAAGNSIALESPACAGGSKRELKN